MLNPLHILKNSSKLTIAGMIGTALNFPISIIVANKLGPAVFGQVSFVLLWLTYAGLVRLGLFEGSQRELIHNLGQKRGDRARYYQNIGLSGEFIFALVPATLLFSAAFFFPDPIRRVGFLLAPLTYLGAALSRMLGGCHFAHQRVGLCARVNLVRSVALPLLLLGLAFVIGPYSLFVAPLIVEWSIALLYLTLAPALGLEWKIDTAEARRLLRAGLPLGLSALVYWAYRLTGLTSVAVWLPSQQLGYYAFSARLIDLALRPFGDFSAVLMPTFWTELGRAGNIHDLAPDAIKISLLVTAAACTVSNLFQAGFGPLVQLIAPKFVASTPVFEILAFNIILLTIITMPSLVLDSVVVNRQWLHLGVWFGGLVFNLAANYLVLRQGWGLIAVAWNDIWIQMGVVVLIYRVAGPHLFPTRVGAWRFYGIQAILLGLCGSLFMLLKWSAISSGSVRDPARLLTMLGSRLLIVMAVWCGVCFSLYRYQRRTTMKIDAAQRTVGLL